MPDQSVNIGADTGSAQSAVNTLANAFKTLADAQRSFAQSVSAGNQLSTASQEALSRLSQATEGVSKTFQDLINQQNLLNVSSKETAEQQKLTADAIRQQAEAAKLVTASSQPVFAGAGIPPPPPIGGLIAAGGEEGGGGDKARKAIELSKQLASQAGVTPAFLGSLTPERAEQARELLNKVAQSIYSGDTSAKAFQKALANLATGGFEPVVGATARAVKLFQDFQQFARAAAVAAEQATRQTQSAEAARQGVLGAIAPLGITNQAIAGLDPDKVVQLRKIITDISEDFRKGQIDAQGLSNIIGNLDKATLGPVTDTEIRLRKLVSVFKDLQEQAARASVTFDQTTSLVNRALEGIGITQGKIATAGLSPTQLNAVRTNINQLAAVLNSVKNPAEAVELAIKSLTGNALIPLGREAAAVQQPLISIQNSLRDQVQRISLSLEGMFRLIEVFIIRRILFSLFQQFQDAAKQAVEFDQQISKIAITSGQSESSLDHFREVVRGLGLEFGRSNLEIGKAAFITINERFDSITGSLNTLRESLVLARTTFETTDEAAKVLVDTLEQFNLRGNEANATAAKLFAAVQGGKVPLKDIQSLIDRTGVQAKDLGVSLDEVVAAFISLREQGLSSQRAITILSSTLNQFVSSNSSLNEVFAKQGASTAQQAVRSLGLAGALKVLNEENLNGSQKTKEFGDAILGLGKNSANLEDGLNRLAKATENYGNAAGKAADSSAAKLQRLAGAWQKYKEGNAEFITGVGLIVVNILDKLGLTAGNTADKINQANQALLGEQSGIEAKHFEEVRRGYNQLYDSIEKNTFDFLISLRGAYQNSSDAIKENFKGISDVVKKIQTDTNNFIKESQKGLTSVVDRLQQQAFERKIAGAPPGVAAAEAQQRVNELLARARALFATGGIEQAKEAQRLFEEAGNLMVQNTQRISQFGKEYAAYQAQINRLTGDHLRSVDNLLTAEGRVKDIQAEELKHRQAIAAAGGKETQVEQQRHLLAQQAAAAALTNRKITEEEIASAQKLLNVEENRFRTQFAANPAALAAAEQEIQLRRLTLELIQRTQSAQQQQAGLGRFATDAQSRIEGERKLTLETIDNIQKRIKAIKDEQEAATNAQRVLIEAIKGQEAQFEKTGLGLSIGPTQGDLTNVKNVESLLRTIATVRKDLENKEASGLTSGPANRQALEILDKMQKSAQALQGFAAGSGGFNQRLLDQTKELAALQDRLPAAQGTLSESFNQSALSAERLTTNIGNFKSSLDSALGTLNQVRQSLEQIEAVSNRIRIPTGGGGGGGAAVPVPGLASGGIINYGPPGTDATLARVTRGEFIVNPESTAKFYSQLIAMNRGSFPRFASGGLVNNSNTNVGDININMSGHQGIEGLTREFASKLNREIRRGTIRFGK